MKKSEAWCLIVVLALGAFGVQKIPAGEVFSENFGSLPAGTTITTDNTGLNYARVGSSSTGSGPGNFLYATNDQFSGTSAVLGALGGSLTGIGVSNLTSFAVGTLSASLYAPSASDLNGLYITLGTGANFVNNSTFSTAQLTAGLSFFNGNIQTRTGSWVNIGTDIFSGNTAYDLSFVFNDSSSPVNYGTGYSLAPGTGDVWINGSLYGDDISIAGNQTVSAFRIYTVSSSSPFEIDNVLLSDSADAPAVVPEPSAFVLAALGGLSCLPFFRKKR